MIKLKFVALFIGVMVLGAAQFPGKAGAAGGDTLVAAGRSLAQCVSECVRRNGKDEQENCEYRCSAGKAQSKPVDCMGDFKACRRGCGSDKSCQRACKSSLMRCK